MDSNNVAYFLLRNAEEFAHRSSRMLWDQQRGALLLGQNQELRLPAVASGEALAAWADATPLVLDAFYQQGRIAATGERIEYNAGRGFLPLVDGNLQPVRAPAGDFTDLHVGGDGRLAAGYSDAATDNHGLLVFHLARRWRRTVSLPEGPLRVLVDCHDRIWCVTGQLLLRCSGEPLPHGYVPRQERFEPVTVNPHPLHIDWQTALAVEDQPLALCADRDWLYLLVHRGEQQFVLSWSLSHPGDAGRRHVLGVACPFAIDIGVVAPGRLALLAPRENGDSGFRQRDCCIVQLRRDSDNEQGEALLIRERYPMLSQAVPRFVGSADGQLRYQGEVAPDSAEAAAGYSIHARELHPLQRPRYFTAARATLQESLDSGQPDTVWHRVYLEGCIPSGGKVVLYARTYNNPEDRRRTPFVRQPDWVWCRQRSDQPFGKGLVEAKPDSSGLFELLLQGNAGPVRRLTGRYLQLRLRLESHGRRSPAVHALKIYYPRFSYQEAYLPEHFRQEQAVDPAQRDLPANGADFRERMLAAFEGVLTPLEGQIASSEVLLSPGQTPEQHLPWLAELLGQVFPGHWPTARKRRWLEATGILQRCRGTLAGLNLALDILTDGAVARGQVVLVENFRLRRTMATILGLSMDDSDHPLTLGTGMSGNSLVGESLILSEAQGREFLALFAPELAGEEDRAVIEEFFQRYANQVTVLLHGPARALQNVVHSVLEEQMPAHLRWRIVATDHPFVLGLAPLLTVDTYLEKRPEPAPVVLDDTYLGGEGLLHNAAALSPQDVNAHG